MNTLIIGNQTTEQRRAAILQAVKTGKPEPAARLDFRNLEDALHLLTEKRWHILKEMTGAGPLAIREIARRMKRDVRAVHSDITQLYRNGVIDKTEDGKMILPYEVIRLDFTFDARKAA
jgi:predicted transcriptional regulator